MPLTGFTLDSPPDSEFIHNFFNSHVPYFASYFNFKPDCKIQIDYNVAEEVIQRYLEDMDCYDRYSDIGEPNVFKRLGHLAFWIRKLKPIKTVTPADASPIVPVINEAIALLIAFLYCDYSPDNPRVSYSIVLSDNQWRDVMGYLRYKSVSPHSMWMILSSIYVTNFVKKE